MGGTELSHDVLYKPPHQLKASASELGLFDLQLIHPRILEPNECSDLCLSIEHPIREQWAYIQSNNEDSVYLRYHSHSSNNELNSMDASDNLLTLLSTRRH